MSDDGLSLDEYVRQTLLSIVAGVLAAQSDSKCGPFVGRSPDSAGMQELSKDRHGNTISLVKFDLATTVDSKSEKGAIGGIKVLPFMSASVDGKSGTASSLVNRIAFAVPVAIPKPDLQRREDEQRDGLRAVGMAVAVERI